MRRAERPSSDEELLNACRIGDEEAWRELVVRFHGLVWEVARAERLSPAECEEVSQQTWFKLAVHIRSIRRPESLKTWLATVTRNQARNERRYRSRTVPVGDATALEEALETPDPGEIGLTPEAALIEREQLADLRGALPALPAHCRLVLAMLFADPPASYRDLARLLKVRPSSVGPMRARCMRCLRQLLGVSS